MYITCEQCSTIYRLDETLLNPSGSRVRCSQCRYVFVAEPPEGGLLDVDQTEIMPDSVDQYQDTFDQELEGIDVAELDSILEQGRTAAGGAAALNAMDSDEDEEPVEFNEADLDMDFDAAFSEEMNIPEAADTAVGTPDQAPGPELEDLSGEIDLDMDFELDDGDGVFAQPVVSEDDELDMDLDMDFDLDDTIEDSESIETSNEDIVADDIQASDEAGTLDEEVMLGEDVELALDDFEDVLGDAVGSEDQDLLDVEADVENNELGIELGEDSTQEPDGITAGEEISLDAEEGGLDLLLDDAEEVVESEISEADLNLEADTAPPKTEGEDLDLTGLDSLLDEEDEGAGIDDSTPEDVELSLDDEFQLDLDEEPVSDEAPAEAEATAEESPKDDIDDVDLTGLDDLLGVDEDIEGSAVSKGEDINLDEDLELSLDDGAVLDDVLDESDAPDVSEDAKDDDLDLAGLDDFLDEDDEEPVQAAVSEDAELSLDDDLELSLDEDAVLDDAASDEPDIMALADDIQGDDLDLGGLDDLLDDDEEPVQDAVSVDEDLSLDLDEDLGLDEDFELSLDNEIDGETDSEPSAEAVVSADQNNRDEFDLSEFEDLLDEDAAPDEETAAVVDDEITLADESTPEMATDDSDDFDMSELSNLLDEEPGADDGQEDDIDLELDDDFELSLDDETGLELETDDASGQLVTPEEESDDFDLAGLDDMLMDEDETDSPKASDNEVSLSLDDDDMELSLDDDDMELSLDEDATEALGDDSGDLEDLEFELDAEFEDKPISQDAEPTQVEQQAATTDSDLSDEALDLSDIEQMLEDDTIVPEASGATQGLMDSDIADDDEADDGLGLDEDEIDLSEIEEAIDSAEEEALDAPFVDDAEDQELELDLDLESEESKDTDASDDFELELEMEDSPPLASEDQEKDDSDALDLSDFDLSMEDEEKPVVETETVDGGDIQLEFRIEETGPELEIEDPMAAAKSTTSGATTSGFMQMQEEEDFSVEETIATEPIGEPPTPGVAKPPKSKGMSKALLFLILILLLLVAGGYFGYDYVVKNNIQIPYLSDYINPEAKDPSGVQQLATLEINSKFIENETDGRLFVITGKVRNGYSISRKLIRLRGKLYTKGKVLAKTEQTFAGLVLADQELSSKPIADIKKGLSSTIGQDGAITVAPGNSAPFMVVFSNLPEDLDEFVIELVSSIKAQ